MDARTGNEELDASLDAWDYEADFRRKHGAVKIAVYVVLMFVSFVMQSRLQSSIHQGIVAQFQVILSVFLVVSLPKYGFLTAILALGIEFLVILSRILMAGDWSVLPGLFVCFCAMIVVTIISLFGRRLNRKHLELRRHKDELSELNREIALAGERALHLANHDSVTGLINAACLRNLLDDFHAGRDEEAPRDALVMIELENFKLIDSIVGRRNGELILQEIAQRIQAKAAEHPAVVARLEGSCFALFAPFEPDRLEPAVQAIQAAIHAPLTLGEEVLEIRSCAGYALASNDAVDTESLLRCADLALTAAREERRSGVKRYDSAMSRRARRRVDMANEMEMALERHEFEMRYQPQVDANSGLVVGAEALVRWQNGRLGSMSPAEFIPLAEQNGQIVPVGNWIMEQACRDAVSWPSNWKVAVNVSAGQFINRDFEDEVERARERSGLRAGRLKIEVTESLLIGEELKVEEILRRLRSRSMTVALDDFGTGYSSLSYLTSLPLDELKIDRSFVIAMESDTRTLAIVETILRLAKLLGLSTTAEGVETESQAKLLRDMGCDRFQGYLYGKPVTQAQFLERFCPDSLAA
jgi:diguanylate cyclase (GGDEF)-like protein